MLTKYFRSRRRTDLQTDNSDPCHNAAASVAQSAAQSSRCSCSVIVSLKQSLYEAHTNRTRPLTSFTWRMNSNRACCLSGRRDGWSHGWLLGRLFAHLWLSFSLSYSVFLSLSWLHNRKRIGIFNSNSNIAVIDTVVHLILAQLRLVA